MRLAVFPLILAVLFGDDPKSPDPLAKGVRESQVSLELQRKDRRIQFRATAIWKGDGTLTILTAGHALGPEDVGGVIRARRGGTIVSGRVEAVTRNPYYRPGPSGDVPGADNAVAQLKLENADAFLKSMMTADLAAWPILNPDGQSAPIQTLDQFEKPHAVRGGNYSSPRWLEWGPSYSPIPGDSGGGVFVNRNLPGGKTELILVGVVVDRSQNGGGASLLSLEDRWVAQALKEYKPKEKAKSAK